MIINPGKNIFGGVCSAQGFEAHAVECGIKDPEALRLDLGLIYSRSPTTAAGVFTTNQIQAAAVKVCKEHVLGDNIQAILVNSGNANACTGERGVGDARQCAEQVGALLGLEPSKIGVCSTGVIGLPLPIERICDHFPKLVNGLSQIDSQGDLLSRAILTSDTRKKEVAVEYEVEGRRVRVGGCAKGAGMIKPNMATMLCFITTDLEIPEKSHLQECLRDVTEQTFNRITIDGDMSTNDTVLVLANGESGVSIGERGQEGCKLFCQALRYIMDRLAREVVLDGEKVTKFVTLKVEQARSEQDAKRIAEAVSNSPLVKSAWNGNDPNWGRVIHAVGYAQAGIRESLIDISWGEHLACEGGVLGPASITKLREVASQGVFEITINLNLGDSAYTVYASDISPEYVDYNRSEYSYWNALEKSLKHQER